MKTLFQGAVVVSGVSALGAGLMSIGISKDNVIRYKSALTTDKYLLFVHGMQEDFEKAKNVIEDTQHSSLTTIVNRCSLGRPDTATTRIARGLDWPGVHSGLTCPRHKSEPKNMKRNNSFPMLVFVIVFALGAASAYALHASSMDIAAVAVLILTVLAASLISNAIQVADQWNKAVVLRLGKFRTLSGPGLFSSFPSSIALPTGLISVS